MLRYIVVSLISGVLFGVLDAVLHANPLAQQIYQAYQPIAKTSVNALAGIAIDLVYGFILAAIFLMLYKSLPGKSGIAKGTSYAFIAWFFRVVMSAASTYVMYEVPVQTILYSLVAGLIEMLILGLLYGLTLKPSNSAD